MTTIRRHFAWFRRDSGQWAGEWAGCVPCADIPPLSGPDERKVLLNAWHMATVALIASGAVDADAEVWDSDQIAECPRGGLVCLDVTQFQWPVGDHVWHQWDDHDRRLDWGHEHLFIEVNMATLEVVSNQASHRPIRDSVAGQRVFDITGSPLAQFHGHIFGRFVRSGDRWAFEPTGHKAAGAPLLRQLLTEAVDGLDLAAPADVRVAVQR